MRITILIFLIAFNSKIAKKGNLKKSKRKHSNSSKPIIKRT